MENAVTGLDVYLDFLSGYLPVSKKYTINYWKK